MNSNRLVIITILLLLNSTNTLANGLNLIGNRATLAVTSMKGKVEHGGASFYGLNDGFHGRQTANGEIFNTYKMTAAHKTLPFGSKVKVTDKDSGRSVIVRINDRGPYVHGRIIDLSYAAAKKLGMVKKGVARVKIEVLK